MKLYAIQGDVVIAKIEILPKGAKRKNTKVLVHGESGNSHRALTGDVFELGERLFLQTYEPTQIIHEEHDEIPLEMPGAYEIKRQREYTGRDMTRLVID